MKNKIKAIIFDVDGVLIDSKNKHFQALNQTLDFYGYEMISSEDNDRLYRELSTKKKLTLHLASYNLSIDKINEMNDKKQSYVQDIIRTIRSNPRQRETLLKLKREGYVMGVCSNAVWDVLNLVLDKLKIREYFLHALSTQDIQPKPSPEGYGKIIKEMNLSPEEVLICEDSQKGIAAALGSGAFVLKIEDMDDVNERNIILAIEKIEETENKNFLIERQSPS